MMEGLATLPLQIEEKEREEGKQDEELCFFYFFLIFPPLIKSRCQGTIL